MPTVRLLSPSRPHVYLFFYQYKHDIEQIWFPEFLHNDDSHKIYNANWYKACNNEIVFCDSIIALRF